MFDKLFKKVGGGILQSIKRIHLRNTSFTLLANNCNGGIIYHSLGVRFMSPTVNLFIRTEDYFTFLENIMEALEAQVYEIKTDKTGARYNYPLGELTLGNGKTVQLHFVHYNSFEDARTKWEDRCNRIDLNNLYVLMEMGIETTDYYVRRFQNLPFKHKVAITNREYPDADSAIFIDIYGETFKWGKMVSRIPGTLHRYIELFDYVHWLNTGEIKHAKFYKKLIQQNP